MARVLLVTGANARHRARLRDACGTGHDLAFVEGWHQVPPALERDSYDVVVVEAGRRETLPSPRFAWLRRQHPGTATLIVIDARGRELDLFRLGRLGVDEVLLDEGGSALADLPNALDRTLARGLARRVASRLDGRLPGAVVDGLSWGVEHAERGPSPAALAAGLGHPIGRYRRELRRAAAPPPQRILMWARLIRAAHLLHAEPGPVERVAHRLGYQAPTSLARALRRETGLSPTEVRARGGVGAVLEALLNEE